MVPDFARDGPEEDRGGLVKAVTTSLVEVHVIAGRDARSMETGTCW